MPGIARTDFSGGMITDVSELLMPENAVRNAQNIDLWSEIGAVKLFHTFLFKHSFPTGKRYDHHVIFPVQGDKDYAIIMTTDGNIYTYEPVGGFSASLMAVTVGAHMVYAGESVYVFYRAMSNPSLANTIRKRIYWDYDTSAFIVEDVIINERIFIGNVFEVANTVSNSLVYYKLILTSIIGDGSESFGHLKIDVLSYGRDHYLVINTISGYFRARIYLAFKANNSDSFLSPQFCYELEATDKKSFIPMVSGQFTSAPTGSPGIRIYYEDGIGTNVQTFWTTILEEIVTGGTLFITPGNKIKVFGVEVEVVSITKNVTNKWYFIEVDNVIPAIASFANDNDRYAVIEIQLNWIQSGSVYYLWIPISKRYIDLISTPVDENRPEGKFTSGTGNVSAFASNKLFTANPYFPDVFSTGKDNDKKGFIGWNYITGEGKHAYSLIPDIQLISPTFSGSRIIDMFGFQDTLFILMESGIARLKYDAGISFLQSDKYGVSSRNKYFVDLGNMFIFSENKLYSGAVDKLNYETGSFDFIELGRTISSLLSSLVNPRIVYDNINELIYISDLDDGSNYICSLRDGKPVWVKLDTGGLYFTSGFRLGGNFYFVNTIVARDEISTNNSSLYGNDVVIEDKNVYIPMSNDFIRKLEVLYQKTSGTLSFELILDGVTVKTYTLSNKTSIGFEELKVPRGGTTRFEKIRWKLTGSSLSSDFKFLGVFINRDDYGKETQRGY